jgi:uridylate kinase
MNNNFVIKLGGSAISKSYEKLIDYDYLQSFLKVINQSDSKFFVTIGGGFLSRQFVESAKKAGLQETIELHKIGRTSCIMNAELVRAFFYKYADDYVFKYDDFFADTPITIDNKMLIGGAGRPGTSSDMGAVQTAIRLGTDKVISLKNINGVYDSDPKQNPNAQQIRSLSWDKYLEIIGGKSEHTPGGNYPVDPIASNLAKQNNIKFYILDAKDLESFDNILKNKDFDGSIIS